MTNVLTQIAACNDVAQLDAWAQAIRNQRLIAMPRVSTRAFRPGDTVTFNATIRPIYMIGLTATVVKVNDKSVTVSCPDDAKYGRFRNSPKVRCPIGLIEPKESPK
jgi:hypothetical protein